MTCARCRADNREGRRFCAECGAPLAAPCAACGFSNEPGEKFCGGCGQPLRTAPAAGMRAEPPAPQAYTPSHLAEKILTSKAALEGERKQVTVLFADLKGSLELLADRDPEEARALLDPVLAIMMEAVHRYEGTVNQVMGDGIMALFGAPLAHEDHAVRACYAALRMQEAIGRYGAELQRREGVPVQYTFKHALTHEVAYGGLLQDRRRGLHRRVGEAIEARHAERLGDFSEALGSHFERGGVWGRAARHYLDAALRAKDRYAYQSAVRLCERALEAAEKAEPVPEERIQSLVLLGDLWSLLGDLDKANRRYERALGAAGPPQARRPIANRLHRPGSVVRDGAKIVFYQHGGGAQAILMTNPLVYGLAIFQPVIEQLAQEFRLITLDPRGTGASDPLPSQYSLADHMEDMRAVIEEAGAAPVVGVGISRGGNLLVKLSVAHPGLLDRLVLVGTPKSYVPVEKGQFHEALARGGLEAAMRLFWPTVHSEPGTDDLVEQAVQHSLRLPAATVLNFFFDDPERDIVPLLGRVRVPTLVIHGTADRRVPFENARYLAEHIPGARLLPFEGRGHLPLFTATREFCEALREFARSATVLPAEAPAPRHGT